MSQANLEKYLKERLEGCSSCLDQLNDIMLSVRCQEHYGSDGSVTWWGLYIGVWEAGENGSSSTCQAYTPSGQEFGDTTTTGERCWEPVDDSMYLCALHSHLIDEHDVEISDPIPSS